MCSEKKSREYSSQCFQDLLHIWILNDCVHNLKWRIDWEKDNMQLRFSHTRWKKEENSTADVYILQDKCSGTQRFSSDGSVRDSWWFIVVRHRGGKVWDSEWLLTWTPEWAALQEVQREKTSGGWRWRRGITPSWPAAPRDTRASLRIHNTTDFSEIHLNHIICLQL